MQDKHLFLIALILSVIGLLFLLFIPLNESKLITIKEINKLPLDSNVKIRGVINNIYKTDKILTFNLTDPTDTIKITLFNPKDINLNKNSNIEVSGIVKTYNNNLEIHANTIKKL